MLREMAGATTPLSWLAPPVRNETTRLAAELVPATGEGWVQGWEEDGPATSVTALA